MSMFRKFLTMSAMVGGGMAVGAGVGMLFAPNSGRVTREKIREHMHKAQEEVTDMGGRVMQKVDTALEEVTHMGGRVMQNVDIALEKGKQVLTNHKEV